MLLLLLLQVRSPHLSGLSAEPQEREEEKVQQSTHGEHSFGINVHHHIIALLFIIVLNYLAPIKHIIIILYIIALKPSVNIFFRAILFIQLFSYVFYFHLPTSPPGGIRRYVKWLTY